MINNVLEEIKRMRDERFSKESPNTIHPRHFNMHIDKVAKETTKYYSDIRGQDANTYRFRDSNYEDSLRKDDKTHFSVYKDPKTMDYLNKIYGIPSNLKFSNNENTLYYEKQLGNKSELDFATEHFDRSEVTANVIDRQISKNPDKEQAVKDIIMHLQLKIKNDISTKRINKRISEKLNPQKLPVSLIAPKSVTVSPAFAASLPDEDENEVAQLTPAAPAVVGEEPVKDKKKAAKKKKAVNDFKAKLAVAKTKHTGKPKKEEYDNMSEVTMVDKPIKRGRGRPRKVKEDTSTVAMYFPSKASTKTPRTPQPLSERMDNTNEVSSKAKAAGTIRKIINAKFDKPQYEANIRKKLENALGTPDVTPIGLRSRKPKSTPK
jgi:hypothetical protein